MNEEKKSNTSDMIIGEIDQENTERSAKKPESDNHKK